MATNKILEDMEALLEEANRRLADSKAQKITAPVKRSKVLTDTAIKKSKPTDKMYTMNDGKGMYLEINPNGTKYWRFRYRFNDKTKKVSFGVYPDVTLSDARTKRDEARNKIANGMDPFLKIVKVEPKLEKTFEEWSDWYIEKVQDDVSEGHIIRTKKGWKKDVMPEIGGMEMTKIKTKDIIRIMHIMDERGARESARKMFSSISRVYQVAIANYPEDVESNPCKDIKIGDVLGKSQEVHFPVITDASELGMLLKTICTYNDGNLRPISTSIILALKMISNVFVRPTNIRHAVWSEIDLNKKRWTIPANKMKTKKEFIIPLSSQMLELLEDAKILNPDMKPMIRKKKVDGKDVEENLGALIFPSPKSVTQPLSDGALVGALRRIGYTKEDIVAHSFRGIFSTIAHEKDVYSHDVIETQLAHSVGSKVSQAYNRAVYLKERTQMMQWYSDLLEGYENNA